MLASVRLARSGSRAVVHAVLGAVLVVSAILLLAGCSSDEPDISLGEETILEPVEEASDGILEVPGEETEEPEDAQPVVANSMFGKLDALVSPVVPALSGSVDVEPLGPEDTLAFGGFATETLDGQPIAPGICLGAEARLGGAVSRGEVRQPIEWMGCSDDAGFTERTENTLDRLRFREPFAIVPLMSDRFFSEALLNTEYVPYIGIGSQPAFCDISNSFGFAVTGARGCPVLDVIGYATSGPLLQAWAEGAAVDPIGLRIAHIVEASVSGDERARSRALEAEAVGARIVLLDNSLAAAGASSEEDFDRVAGGVVQANPDVVVVEMNGADGLYPRLRRAGFNGHIVGVEVDPALLVADEGLRERFADTWQVLSGLSVVPSATSMDADVELLGVLPEEIGAGFVAGYASMDFFLTALRALEDAGRPIGRVELRDFINDGWSYPGIEGVACGSDWPSAHLASVPCASVVRVDVQGMLREVLPPTEYPLLIERVQE